MILKRLFILHAIVTLAAAVLLVLKPVVIPHTVGISIQPGQYLLCYLLAGMEAGAAALSFLSSHLADRSALRAISLSFIVMHAATAVLEVLAFAEGVRAGVLANVALRIVMVLLFARNGLYKMPYQRKGRPQ